jgi:hypothetical protein
VQRFTPPPCCCSTFQPDLPFFHPPQINATVRARVIVSEIFNILTCVSLLASAYKVCRGSLLVRVNPPALPAHPHCADPPRSVPPSGGQGRLARGQRCDQPPDSNLHRYKETDTSKPIDSPVLKPPIQRHTHPTFRNHHTAVREPCIVQLCCHRQRRLESLGLSLDVPLGPGGCELRSHFWPAASSSMLFWAQRHA